MKSVSAFAVRAVSAAAVAFTAMKLTYGTAEYAAVGPLSVSVDMLLKAVPALAGIVYPLVVQKWPSLAAMMSLIVQIVKYRSPEAASVLGKVSALEVYAKQSGCEKTQAACATIREQVLKSVK